MNYQKEKSKVNHTTYKKEKRMENNPTLKEIKELQKDNVVEVNIVPVDEAKSKPNPILELNQKFIQLSENVANVHSMVKTLQDLYGAMSQELTHRMDQLEKKTEFINYMADKAKQDNKQMHETNGIRTCVGVIFSLLGYHLLTKWLFQ